jgi:DNA-binding transcriptional LysR family regulator
MKAHAPADLDSLAVFAAVAEAGGFTAAALRLGVTKARVSTVVRRLEAALGLSLFVRTTRRVALTEAGQRLHERCTPLLQALGEALSEAGTQNRPLAGTLRIGSPIDHAVQVMGAVVAGFAREHPQLQVELRASDRRADLVAEGVDVALRLGWLRDSSARATRLGEFEQWLVAAPAYLRQVPAPRRPADVAGLDWIALTLLPTPLTWRFSSRRGAVHNVRMGSRLRTDSSAALRALVLQGAGVTALAATSAAQDVAEGRLVRLLPHWSLPSGGIHAVFPPGRHISAAARAFVEFYRSRIGPA